MKIFSIAGWSGSGKTTLILKLIKHFKANNKRVAAVKHVPNKFHLEPESKDSFRYLEAGADEVCLAAAHQLLTMKQIRHPDEIFRHLAQQYSGYDILLLEGLRRPGIPLIEVFNSNTQPTLKFPLADLSAVVSDKPMTQAVPNFFFDDINEICHFMEVYDG